MTIEQINQIQDIVRSYNNAPIPYEELAAECAKKGLDTVLIFLLNNHYIARLSDGNTFFNWSKNRFYPEATIINLKAELNGQTRKLTIEERLEIIEQRLDKLEEKL